MPRLQIQAGSLQPRGRCDELEAVRSESRDRLSQGVALLRQISAKLSDRAERLRRASVRQGCDSADLVGQAQLAPQESALRQSFDLLS